MNSGKHSPDPRLKPTDLQIHNTHTPASLSQTHTHRKNTDNTESCIKLTLNLLVKGVWTEGLWEIKEPREKQQ